MSYAIDSKGRWGFGKGQFQMRGLYGFSTKEVADKLQITTSAVNSRVRHAKAELGLQLGEFNRAQPLQYDSKGSVSRWFAEARPSRHYSTNHQARIWGPARANRMMEI